MTGHEECVEALLQHSANFLAQDCKGRTPIHLAAACGHIGVLGGLLHAAQSLETLPVLTDSQGYTPLHWACYNGTETRLENSLLFKKKEMQEIVECSSLKEAFIFLYENLINSLCRSRYVCGGFTGT